MKLGELCSACGLTCEKKHAVKDPTTGKTTYVDPCLGVLPGVKYACCGHQDEPGHNGYIFFENGVIIRFDSIVDVEVNTFSAYHAFNDKTTKPKRK